METHIEEFRMAMATAGVTPPEHISVGKLQRFSTNGKPKSGNASSARIASAAVAFNASNLVAAGKNLRSDREAGSLVHGGARGEALNDAQHIVRLAD